MIFSSAVGWMKRKKSNVIPTAAKYQRYVRWWWTMISDQPWGTWIMLLKRGLTSILMSEWPHWPDLNEDNIVLCINSHRLKDGFYGNQHSFCCQSIRSGTLCEYFKYNIASHTSQFKFSFLFWPVIPLNCLINEWLY